MNLFFCLWMKYPSKKKKKKNDGETASLRAAHDAKFLSVIFFFSDGYSIHKQKK
jgi:hypothetical protein